MGSCYKHPVDACASAISCSAHDMTTAFVWFAKRQERKGPAWSAERLVCSLGIEEQRQPQSAQHYVVRIMREKAGRGGRYHSAICFLLDSSIRLLF